MKPTVINFIKEYKLKFQICSSIYYYDNVGSTNNIVKTIMQENNKKNFAVIAQVQTSGYGRRGNFWESPQGGLWSSLLIEPSFDLKNVGLIPSLCALSVAKTLQEYEINTRLKWPNDILFLENNRKLGGILVEGKVKQASMEYLIIGIGLNVNNRIDQFSPQLRTKITSTYMVKKEEINVLELYNKILVNLEKGLRIINSSQGEIILNQWKEWANILGYRLKIISNNIQYEGKAYDISSDGRLILKIDDGRLIKFSSGHVDLLASDGI